MSSITVTELTRAILAAYGDKIIANFQVVATQAFQANGAGLETLPHIMNWLKTAVDQTGAGAASITVGVNGGAVAAAPGAFMQAGGLAPQGLPGNFASPVAQQTPFAQAGGLLGFAQSSPMTPGAGAGGAGLPDNGVRTRTECGLCCVPWDGNPISRPPQGAKCGFEFTKRDLPGQKFYCTKLATVVADKCKIWSCGGCKGKSGPDGRAGGGKKSGSAATSAVSAAQVRSLQTPTMVPAGFQANPGMVGNLAGIMGQNPQSAFGGAPMAGNPMMGQPSSHMLSNQLMQSVQGQVGGIPQQFGGIQPGGANMNMGTLLQQPTPSAVNVQPFNPMAPPPGAQFTPNVQFVQPQGPGPIVPGGPGVFGSSAPLVVDSDDDGESSSDDDDEAPPSIPLPVTNQNDLMAALAVAHGAPGQMGGQSVTVANPQFPQQQQVQFVGQVNPQFAQQPQQPQQQFQQQAQPQIQHQAPQQQFQTQPQQQFQTQPQQNGGLTLGPGFASLQPQIQQQAPQQQAFGGPQPTASPLQNALSAAQPAPGQQVASATPTLMANTTDIAAMLAAQSQPPK